MSLNLTFVFSFAHTHTYSKAWLLPFFPEVKSCPWTWPLFFLLHTHTPIPRHGFCPSFQRLNHVPEPDLCFFFCTHTHSYSKAWLLPFFPEVKSCLLKEEERILSPSLAEEGRVQAEKANFLCWVDGQANFSAWHTEGEMGLTSAQSSCLACF